MKGWRPSQWGEESPFAQSGYTKVGQKHCHFPECTRPRMTRWRRARKGKGRRRLAMCGRFCEAHAMQKRRHGVENMKPINEEASARMKRSAAARRRKK